MAYDAIDFPALIRAIGWPLIAAGALIVFGRPILELINALGARINKVSVAGVSLELATLSELRPRSLDIDLRELDAGTRPQSGPIDLLAQLRASDSRDYVVIDLGSTSSPRWLTSRLYLFGLLSARVNQLKLKCFVFVETVREIRNRFVGIASPDSVRWALARRYPWLEHAYALVYSQIGLPRFDPNSGALSEWQTTDLIQKFFAAIRVPGTTQLAFPDPNHVPDTVDLGNGILEYARWVDGGRIERLLASDLSTESIMVPPGKSLDDMLSVVLGLRGRFVGIVEGDRIFRGLLDRHAALEKLAKQAASTMRPML
jgi:hypothetical protein